MSFDLKTLAVLLKQSSLNEETKESLLEILPILPESQLEEIAQTLSEDIAIQESVMKQLELKIDILKREKPHE